MKKFIFIVFGLLISVSAQAQNIYENKCTDLMTNLKDNRAVLFNVLNLSKEQQGYKDKIDKNYEALFAQAYENYNREKFILENLKKHNASNNALRKQQRIVKNTEDKIFELCNKSDKEYKSILNNYQYSKLKSIKQSERSALKYCRRVKAFYKTDENFRPFGMKY